MTNPVSSIAQILEALPEVQSAVKSEILIRIARGEIITSQDYDQLAKQPAPYLGRASNELKSNKRKSVA
jgi:hypothetical protein